MISSTTKPIDKVIHDVLKSSSDAETTKTVVEWFATDEGQDYLSKRIDNSYEEYKKWINDVDSSNKLQYTIKQQANLRLRPMRFIKWVAVLLPLVLLLSGGVYLHRNFYIFGKSPIINIQVPLGETKHIIFQDGTSVYLGPGSTLSYPQHFSVIAREIYFSGEAHFDVKSNKNWPFIIRMNETRIKVLGTSFNVVAYGDMSQVKVYLNSGKIKFQPYNSNNEYNMETEDLLLYDKITKEVKLEKGKDKIYCDWKQEEILLNDAPLKDVLDFLSRKYNVQFNLSDNSLNEFCYTMNLSKKSLDIILKDMESITPLRFVQQGSIFYVKKK